MKPLIPIAPALSALCLLLATPEAVHAQKSKDVKVTFEDVKKRCPEKELKDKLRLSVTRFNVTTRNAPSELGANMATMLESALHEVGCFNVLESMDNVGDLKQELAGNEDLKGGTAGRRGQMLVAKVVVTGEVTEYNQGSKGVSVGPYQNKSGIVRLGFIVKMLNPETRETLWQESVNVEGESSGSSSVGVGIPFGPRMNFGSSMKDNPALANALEQGVLRASELLVNNYEKLPAEILSNVETNTTQVTVAGVDYGGVVALASTLSAVPGVKVVEKSLADGVGKVTLSHEGSTSDLLDKIYGSLASSYTVGKVENGVIALARK